MKIACACLALLLGGCNAIPKDPDGTMSNIEKSGRLRVALIALPSKEAVVAGKLVRLLEQRTGASAEIRPGTGEVALTALRQGQVDLVIGSFAKDTPWATDVAFGPPLALSGSEEEMVEVKAAVRNGENRWLMAVEGASRAAAPQAAK